MEQNENDMHRYGGMRSSRVWSGLILVTAGGLYLANKIHPFIVLKWDVLWPAILIFFGLLAGIKSRFHNPGALIMIIVGGFFLIDNTNPELNFHTYIVPVILISVGLVFILKPRHNWKDMSKHNWKDMSKKDWLRKYYEKKYYENMPPADPASLNYSDPKNMNSAQEDNAESIEINTAFGSVKKIILSKNFKGGEINNFMGGTEINLMKADIQHPIELEINNVFGGTKLIVPSNWDVKNEVTAVFGGIEDKRTITGSVTDPQKIIIMKGTCVFGGIEVTNY